MDRNLVPSPWQHVALFVQKYITCMGRFTIVFQNHFMILSHLRHRQLLDIPYFLWESLKLVDQFVHRSKHPHACVTNHGLIKLLVIRALEQRNRTWLEFIPPTESPVREDSEENSEGKASKENEERGFE